MKWKSKRITYKLALKRQAYLLILLSLFILSIGVSNYIINAILIKDEEMPGIKSNRLSQEQDIQAKVDTKSSQEEINLMSRNQKEPVVQDMQKKTEHNANIICETCIDNNPTPRPVDTKPSKHKSVPDTITSSHEAANNNKQEELNQKSASTSNGEQNIDDVAPPILEQVKKTISIDQSISPGEKTALKSNGKGNEVEINEPNAPKSVPAAAKTDKHHQLNTEDEKIYDDKFNDDILNSLRDSFDLEIEIEDHREAKNAGKRQNYASLDAGATILDSSPSTKGASNLLVPDKDRYMLAPCKETKKWVVVSLSEDVHADTLMIANHEKFSSSIKEFLVLGSVHYPTDTWYVLGNFTASNMAGEQYFVLDNQHHVRYLKLRFLTHFGSEYYCTLSQMKVYGQTFTQVISNLEKSIDAEGLLTPQESPISHPPVQSTKSDASISNQDENIKNNERQNYGSVNSSLSTHVVANASTPSSQCLIVFAENPLLISSIAQSTTSPSGTSLEICFDEAVKRLGHSQQAEVLDNEDMTYMDPNSPYDSESDTIGTDESKTADNHHNPHHQTKADRPISEVIAVQLNKEGGITSTTISNPKSARQVNRQQDNNAQHIETEVASDLTPPGSSGSSVPPIPTINNPSSGHSSSLSSTIPSLGRLESIFVRITKKIQSLELNQSILTRNLNEFRQQQRDTIDIVQEAQDEILLQLHDQQTLLNNLSRHVEEERNKSVVAQVETQKMLAMLRRQNAALWHDLVLLQNLIQRIQKGAYMCGATFILVLTFYGLVLLCRWVMDCKIRADLRQFMHRMHNFTSLETSTVKDENNNAKRRHTITSNTKLNTNNDNKPNQLNNMQRKSSGTSPEKLMKTLQFKDMEKWKTETNDMFGMKSVDKIKEEILRKERTLSN